MILSLETSTKACSVALGKKGKLLALKESVDAQYSHSENLTVYIQEVCEQAGVTLREIDAVAVSKGPGSFTGLRIGISAAKGLCYALGKPLIAVNSLEVMAAGVVHEKINNLSLYSSLQEVDMTVLLCPMIDARRMEVYCAVFDVKLDQIKKTSAEIIESNSFSELLQKNKILYFGDGSEKCKMLLTHPNAHFLDHINPSAQYMLPLADKLFSEKKFEDVAYFEPFYLKDFVGSGGPPR